MKDVVKSMTTERQMLQEWPFIMNQGGICYIVGPSGAEINLYSCFTVVKHDKGTLKVAGFDTDKIKKRDIRYLRQKYWEWILDTNCFLKTVYENVPTQWK